MNFGFIFTLLLGIVISHHWKGSAFHRERWSGGLGDNQLSLWCDLAAVTAAVCWALLARLEATAKGESLPWHMVAVFKQHTGVQKSS